MSRIPLMDRLLTRVREDTSGCWVFEGADNGVGYGVIGSGGRESRHLYTHRVTYEFFIAEIPDGLQLDHLCRNRKCCNPWHLDPVTVAVNVARGEARQTSGQWRAEFELAKTHCPLGHAYDAENTYVTPRGHRQCRICKTDAVRRYQDANRERINAAEREKRGYAGPVTACKRAGHPYTPENTYINPSNGKRICVACRRERVNRAYAERKRTTS